MLYSFENLSERLTQLGYPEVAKSGFHVIKKDLTQEERAGNIRFGEDGIYLNVDGTEYKGYMYIKHPYIVRYRNQFPKFHITECEVILEQKTKGNFDNRYYWHNSNLVDLTDIETGDEFEQVTLTLCSKCRTKAQAINYSDTDGFFNLLDTQEIQTNQEVQVDIFGYTLDWQKISRAYRIEKDYTCESCGIKIDEPSDRWQFIHVHHKNGNKLDNRKRNLECVCVCCHSQKDAAHERNFDKRRMRAILKSFVKKYEVQLRELKSPCIDKIQL